MRGTTPLPRTSSPTSACAAPACSRTTQPSGPACGATGYPCAAASRCRHGPARRTYATCAPSATGWVISSKALIIRPSESRCSQLVHIFQEAAMRAMVQTEFGGPEVVSLRNVRDPEPAPLEIVVRVAACGVNRLDVLQRRGPAVIPGFRLPHIAAMDVAGSVAAVGLGVPATSIGDQVLVHPAIGCRASRHRRPSPTADCPRLLDLTWSV